MIGDNPFSPFPSSHLRVEVGGRAAFPSGHQLPNQEWLPILSAATTHERPPKSAETQVPEHGAKSQFSPTRWSCGCRFDGRHDTRPKSEPSHRRAALPRISFCYATRACGTKKIPGSVVFVSNSNLKGNSHVVSNCYFLRSRRYRHFVHCYRYLRKRWRRWRRRRRWRSKQRRYWKNLRPWRCFSNSRFRRRRCSGGRAELCTRILLRQCYCVWTLSLSTLQKNIARPLKGVCCFTASHYF